MIVYKCDYCGKIIESSLNVSGLKFELKKVSSPDVVKKFSSDQTYGLIFEHLCEDCSKKLTEKFIALKNEILKEREESFRKLEKQKETS